MFHRLFLPTPLAKAAVRQSYHRQVMLIPHQSNTKCMRVYAGFVRPRAVHFPKEINLRMNHSLSTRIFQLIARSQHQLRMVSTPLASVISDVSRRYALTVARALRLGRDKACSMRFATTIAKPSDAAMEQSISASTARSGIVVVNPAGSNLSSGTRKLIGYWLIACGLTAAATVSVGGVTRLQEAGLSITRWELISGIFPPTNPMSWRLEFERYKQFPEYKYKNMDMTLDQFQDIWWLEYAHRMMGRLIGVMFFVPAAVLWIKGTLDRPLKRRFAFVGALLAWQGILGWLMVRSGLVGHRHDDPNHVVRVSQYRLAAHLGSALALVASFTYIGSSLFMPTRVAPSSVRSVKPNYLLKIAQARHVVHGCAGLAFFTAISGAFVAGLDAGLVYNTFPKFAGQWIPSDLISERMPFWRNFFENPTMCQFQHRILATLTGVAVLATWLRYNRFMVTRLGKVYLSLAALITLLQYGLGITTLVKNVPTKLAAYHQANNTALIIMLTLLVKELHWVRRVARV